MLHLRKCIHHFILLFLFGLSIQSFAYLELNAFYSTDNFKHSTTNNNTQMLYDVSIGFAVDKKGYYNVGWNYSGHSTSKATTTTETYASTQMGPRFIFFFDKQKMFSLGFAYNLSTKSTFNDGTTPYTWKGTGMKADFGVNFPMGESSLIGVRLNYSSTAYNEQLQNTTTYSVVSYNRTFMYPSIYMFFGF